MRKIIIALLFLFSCSVIPSFAANWYYVAGDDTISFFVDNSSVIKNNHEAVVWVKTINTDGNYALRQVRLTYSPHTFTFLSENFYDATGNIIHSRIYSSYSQKTVPVPPDTFVDAIWHLIWSY